SQKSNSDIEWKEAIDLDISHGSLSTGRQIVKSFHANGSMFSRIVGHANLTGS
ncbi:unnamed protein product, partial [Nesidiocoris tenuis]